MALSRALRDVLRKENGMKSKSGHKENHEGMKKRQHHAHGDVIRDERKDKEKRHLLNQRGD